MRKPALPPSLPKTARPKPKRTVEDIKRESGYLSGPLERDLQNEKPHFSEESRQLLKFHGIYEQDDRDLRKQEKHYEFMVRSRIPAGKLTARQYLVHDDLAGRFANGTLRVTTRQAIQFHGILKSNLKQSIAELNESLVTSYGACGDVVRNVMCCPAPRKTALQAEIEAWADAISTHFLPRTSAYHEIWLDGEKVTADDAEVEPIYGKVYLPRKFKIGIAYPGDNCVDVFTQDVGIIPVTDGDDLIGFNILAGGGLGMSHNKPSTFPRLGDLLGFVVPERLITVVEAIVTAQRDHGNRSNRKNARLKYLIHEWGIDRFRSEVEERTGFAIEPARETPALELELHHGWHPQGDGLWYLGLSIENGRIKDEGSLQLRSGLRAIVERFAPEVRFTPAQDVILADVHEQHKGEIEQMLEAYGIPLPEDVSNTRRFAMACPAMPTCGLALTESERVFPTFIDRLEREIAALGLDRDTFTIRMTGCPNGCARPYTADIGFVGRSLDQYSVFVGGRSDGTRLNTLFRDLVPFDDLVGTVLPLFRWYRDERNGTETFGDYCRRVGIEELQNRVERYEIVS